MSAAAGRAPGLERRLGLWPLALAGIGIILGAGIYVLIGEAAAEAGGFVWLSFLLAALVTAATGLSYAELAALFPSAGASFEYAHRAFNLHVGFVVGWLVLCAQVVAAAAVALGFGGYLDALVGVDRVPAAVILLGAGILIAGSGVLGSIAVAGVLTIVEIGGLVLVTGIGFVDLDASRLIETGGTTAVLQGAALVFFAYIGFEDIATFAEEVREPQRTLPRAIGIAIAASTALYVLAAVAAVGAVGAGALAASEAPLAHVADTVLGGAAGDVLAVIALAATGNTALLLLMAACRVIYGMARAGALPAGLARVSGETRIPLTGLALVGGAAILVSLAGDLGVVADVTNFGFMTAFIFANLAVIAARRRYPDLPRAFQTPGRLGAGRWAWIPLWPVLAIGAIAVLLGSLKWEAIAGGAAVLGAGGVLALLLRPYHDRAQARAAFTTPGVTS